MAARIHELRAKLGKLTTEANALEDQIAAKVAEAGEDAVKDLRVALEAKDSEIAGVRAEADTENRKLERLAAIGSTVQGEPAGAQITNVTGLRPRAEEDPRKGFQNPRDFILATIDNSGLRDRAEVEDERLQPLAVVDKEDKTSRGELAFVLPRAFTPRSLLATVGSDEQSTFNDTYGGFSVPVTRAPGLLQVGFEGDPTAGMTQAIPMASPSVEILARTDGDHTTSVSGGFTVARRAESAATDPSRTALEKITLKAATLMGLAYETEELLTDSAISFAAIVDAGFRSQMGAAILNEKIRGLGGNEYLGVLNSPAAITVSKETSQAADTINFANTSKMISRCWGLDQAVWLANHDTRPQLMTISLAIGTAGVAMYQPSPMAGVPDRLHGRPIFYSEYASTVGDLGDIMLVNWSQFLEGIYQPIQSAESVHVRFVNHERTFKIWTRNCGAPWWRAPLTPHKGATLSPIVILQAR